MRKPKHNNSNLDSAAPKPAPHIHLEKQEVSIVVRPLAAANVQNLTETTLSNEGNLLIHVSKLY